MSHPFIPVEGAARVEVVFDNNGGIVENQFHFVQSGRAWSSEELDALATQVESWLRVQWAQVAVEGATVIKIIATDISAPDSTYIERTPSPVLHGDGAGAGYQRNVSVAMKWLTGLTGRSRRGRTFHVGLRPNLLDTGNPNLLGAGGRDALISVYTDLMGAGAHVGSGAYMAVVSYMANGVWRSSGLVTPITSVSCDFKIDTMRRRMNARPT